MLKKMKMMKTNQIAEVILGMMCDKQYIAFMTTAYISSLYEADVLGINKNEFLIEYEIKRSVSDFKADFKKYNKHYRMIHRMAPIIIRREVFLKIPNRFYYACEEGLIDPKDIPEYAGLVYINKQLAKSQYREVRTNAITEIKSAPLLHKGKATGRMYKQIAHNLSNRMTIGCSYKRYIDSKLTRTKFK